MSSDQKQNITACACDGSLTAFQDALNGTFSGGRVVEVTTIDGSEFTGNYRASVNFVLSLEVIGGVPILMNLGKVVAVQGI